MKLTLEGRRKNKKQEASARPNIEQTKLQSRAMEIPQVIQSIDTIKSDIEELILDELIKTAKKTYDFEGIIHGGILSEYQKDKFNSLCKKNNFP